MSEIFLTPYKDLPLRMVEIGAHQGDSVKTWAQYFKNAEMIKGIRYGENTDSEKIACETLNLKAPCPSVITPIKFTRIFWKFSSTVLVKLEIFQNSKKFDLL